MTAILLFFHSLWYQAILQIYIYKFTNCHVSRDFFGNFFNSTGNAGPSHLKFLFNIKLFIIENLTLTRLTKLQQVYT